MARHIAKGKQLVIALDRTQWKDKNILMASVIYQKRALPICKDFIGEKGSE